MSTTIRTVYSGRSTNWPMIVLSTALLVPLLWMAAGMDDSWTSPGLIIPVCIMLAAAAINLLTATSVRTTAGPNGVSVHFGVVGWPRFHYPLERIAAIHAVTIPSSWWAWGIYWSPRRGLMLTLCTGPAVRLTLTNGRTVTISTPHPESAVAAIDEARDSGGV